LSTTEALDILLYPRFCVQHPLNDEETLQAGFEKEVMKGFQLLKPFNQFIGEVF
jgi:hypothetical protein